MVRVKAKLSSVSIHYFHVLSRSSVAAVAVVVVAAAKPPAEPVGGVVLLRGGCLLLLHLLLLFLPEALTYRGEPALVFNQATALIPDTNSPNSTSLNPNAFRVWRLTPKRVDCF